MALTTPGNKNHVIIAVAKPPKTFVVTSSQTHCVKDVCVRMKAIPVHKQIKTKTAEPIQSHRICLVALSFNCEIPLVSAFNMMNLL